jgi:HlyD family secretion protein
MALKKRTRRFLIIGGLAAVVIVVIIASLGGSGDEATVVSADLAYVDEIAEIVSASGRIQPQTKVDITGEVSAEILAVFVTEGQQVKRGDELLLLDTVQYNSDLSQARYSLDEITARASAAKTQYEKDKLEFERQQRLFEQKLTSETDFTDAKFAFENSKANYDAMLAQVKTQRARVEKAEDNVSKTLIRAPMDGVVTYLNAEAGEIAQAQTAYTQGQTLMTIADLSVFEVEVDVDETEIAKVRLGQIADIRVDAFRDTIFQGTVVEIGNSAIISGAGSDDYSTDFKVKVRLADAGENIRPGMSATVDITTARNDAALLIPYAALVTREFDPDSLESTSETEADPGGTVAGTVNAAEIEDDPAADADTSFGDSTNHSGPGDSRKKEKVKKSGVFVFRGGVAKFVEVSTGIADERNVVAISGVNPGDTVVSGSYQTLRRLKNGETVQLDELSHQRIQEQSDLL